MRSTCCAVVFFALLLACTPTEATATEVVLETSHGDIVVKLNEKQAPLSVKNFLHYVDGNYYSNLIFHRVIDGFMLQGGGFTKELEKKPTVSAVKNEANNGLKNKRGTVALARTADPDSATSQFFINLIDNDFLDHRGMNPQDIGYAVFGEVTSGMDVADKIAKVETLCSSRIRAPCMENLPRGMRDVPKEPVIIRRAYRKK